MYLVCAACGVGSSQRMRQILDKGSPQGNIDYLHALTDAKNGFLHFIKGRKQSQLLAVQGDIRRIAASVFLGKESRMDISASGQQEAVEAGEGILRLWKPYDGTRANPF